MESWFNAFLLQEQEHMFNISLGTRPSHARRRVWCTCIHKLFMGYTDVYRFPEN